MDMKQFFSQMFTPGTVPCAIFGAVMGLVFAVLCMTIGVVKALLIGAQPPLGYEFVDEGYEAVVIGSLTLGQALGAYPEAVLAALASGVPVVAYEPGFPSAVKNRALGASLASRRRELKSWGVRFVTGQEKRLVTAEDARRLLEQGKRPAAGAVLTPLAKEILSNGQLTMDN